LLIININGGIVSEVIRYQGIPFVARFRLSAGELMERFYQSLKAKKLTALKCNCGYTVFPPRIRCPKCYARLTEENLVELSGKGQILSFTKVYFKLDGKGNFVDLDEPQVLASIKLDQSDSIFFAKVCGEPKDGAKVEVVWREETKGEFSDILCFKVVE